MISATVSKTIRGYEIQVYNNNNNTVYTLNYTSSWQQAVEFAMAKGAVDIEEAE